jgi:hypothetical protein
VQRKGNVARDRQQGVYSLSARLIAGFRVAVNAYHLRPPVFESVPEVTPTGDAAVDLIARALAPVTQAILIDRLILLAPGLKELVAQLPKIPHDRALADTERGMLMLDQLDRDDISGLGAANDDRPGYWR